MDLDGLEDIFGDEPVKKAPAAGKFQPKLKPGPRKKVSAVALVSSTLAAPASDLSKTVSTDKPSENEDQLGSGTVSPLHQTVSTNDIAEAVSNVHSKLEFVSSGNGDCSGRVEQSSGENTDIFVGLETLSDFIPHATTETEGSVPPSEVFALNNVDPDNVEGELATPAFSNVIDPTQTANVVDVLTCPEPSTQSDPLTCRETIISRSEEGVDMDTRGPVEEIDVMDSMNMSMLTTKSVQRTGKFQPKSKVRKQKKISASGVESVSNLPDSPARPPEVGSAENFSSLEHDEVLDFSSIGINQSVPTEATSEIPVNEEFIDLMEINQEDSSIHVVGAPEVPAKLVSRRAKTGRKKAPIASDRCPQQHEANTSIQENETGRSLRPRKRKTSLHDQQDESPSGMELSDEFVSFSPIAEDNSNNEQFLAESESNIKKGRQKSEKLHDDTERPDKKRRKGKEVSLEGENTKPKKFSHSTRRRRQVDKVLLETPEDEIDYQKVPLRDLLVLADYRERHAKKEVAAEGKPATKPRNDNPSARHNEDDETFISREDGEYNDGQAIPEAEETGVYFNYQTYMDKEPRAKWTKQDTELFYEGVQQFGTDLSMIQQLFPGRSRKQIKLKYKKEEKQHPLMLRDALTNRSKNHSHFNAVIERLKKIAAEENQNVDNDESVNLTGEEEGEEGSLNAKDEEAKDEHVEDAANNDAVDAAPPSPVKPSYDSEEDVFDWSQYKSDP